MGSKTPGYAVMWCDFVGVWSRGTRRKLMKQLWRYRMKMGIGAAKRCAMCHTKDHLTIDHIVPRSRGGPDRVDNFQALCQDCNTAKGNRLVKEIEAMAIGPVAITTLLCGGEANGG